MNAAEPELNNRKILLFCLNNIYLLSSQLLMRDSIIDKLAEINQLFRLLKPSDLAVLEGQEILVMFRGHINQTTEPEVFTQALSVLRQILSRDPTVSKKYLELNIHILVANTISKNSPLSHQCVLMIRDWLRYAPENFPTLMGFSLKYAAHNYDENSRRLRTLALEAIVLLAVKNLELFIWLGCLSVLVEAIIDPNVDDSVRNIIAKTFITYLFDHPNARRPLVGGFFLGPIFACFIGSGSLSGVAREKLTIASEFLYQALNSPVGLLFLRKNQSYIEYLVESLRHPISDPHIKETIMRLLKRLLKDHHSKPIHTQVLQMQLLINCNLYDVLIELAMISDFEKLSKKLLVLFVKASGRTVAFSQIPSNDFLAYSMKVTEAEEIVEENSIFVSQIKSIIDQKGQVIASGVKFEKEPYEIQRHNTLLYLCENLFLQLNVTFKDNRISKNYIWSSLKKDLGQRMTGLDELKNRFAGNVEQWDLNDFGRLIDLIADNKKIIRNEQMTIILEKFQAYFLSGSQWKNSLHPRDFPMLKASHRFVDVLLNNEHASGLLLQSVAQNKFFKKFLSSIRSNAVVNPFIRRAEPAVKSRRGSLAKPDKNFETSSKLSGLESIDLKHSNITAQFNDKEAFTTDIFSTFSSRIFRELFCFAGQLTFHKKGHELLKNEHFYSDLCKVVKSTDDYDSLIMMFLFNCDYKRYHCRNVLMDCLTYGSVYMAKIAVNVLDFLIETDYFEHLKDQIRYLVQKFKDHENPPELRNMLVKLIVKIIEQTSLEKEMFAFLGLQAIKNEPLLFCSISKKTDFLNAIIAEEGFIQSLYRSFIAEGELARLVVLGEQMTHVDPMDFNEDFAEQYVYPHSANLANNSFEETGFYKAALIQFDWGLKLQISFNQDQETLTLTTRVSYNSELNSIEVEGMTEYDDFSDELIEGLSVDDRRWRASSILTLYGQLLNPSFDIVEEQLAEFYNTVKCSDLKQANEREMRAEKNNVVYSFRITQNGRLIPKRVSLQIFLEKDKLKLSTNSFTDNFLSAMARTEIGTKALQEKGIIKDILEKCVSESNVQIQKSFLYALGLICNEIPGASVLLSPEYDSLLRKLFEEPSVDHLYLSHRAQMYHLANILVRNEVGRRVLQRDGKGQYEWKVLYISKKSLNEADNHYIAIINEKPDSLNDKETLYARLGRQLAVRTEKIHEKYKNSPKELTFIAAVHDTIKGRFALKIDPADVNFNPDLFYFIIYQLAFFEIHNPETRKRLWASIDTFLGDKNFLKILDAKQTKPSDAA